MYGVYLKFKNFPRGFNSEVCEKRNHLSGERQRISIAQFLMQKPK